MAAQAAPDGRVPFVVLPVALAGAGISALAIADIVRWNASTSTIVGVVALLVASLLAERFPVPLEGIDSGGVSLQFVFGIAAVVLWGWEAGALITVVAASAVQLRDGRPRIRIAYNAGVFALAGGAAALAHLVDGRSAAAVSAQLAIAASANYAVNVVLVAAVLAQTNGVAFGRVALASARSTFVPFALMASASLILVVLWQRTPLLAAALVGPLLAIALYQRSHYRALSAMRLALTDPLTGLGNHRHFHERLERELVAVTEGDRPLALCLLDVDDFKGINDRFGHPVGDDVLSQLASRFRQDGEAFRLGGDEFAILLPGHDPDRAVAVAHSVVDRIADIRIDRIGEIRISVGIAAVPDHARSRDELVRVADEALYRAKHEGKGRVVVYRTALVELGSRTPREELEAHFRAAASLAKAVDARDAITGGHSERVGELAARITSRLGLDGEQVELARLAGRLHDLGKLAMPEEILRKAGPLTDAERAILERHPQIGFRMLESLEVGPVCSWVLHHHERWDGGGYPDGLAGSAIPLGARILLVADAYDAMISERAYKTHVAPEDALAELRRCAGTQFDPQVVGALADELGAEPLHPCAGALAS